MTLREMRELAAVEIANREIEMRAQLLQLVLRTQTGQVEKTHELRFHRKQIARLATIQSERKRTQASHQDHRST